MVGKAARSRLSQLIQDTSNLLLQKKLISEEKSITRTKDTKRRDSKTCTTKRNTVTTKPTSTNSAIKTSRRNGKASTTNTDTRKGRSIKAKTGRSVLHKIIHLYLKVNLIFF